MASSDIRELARTLRAAGEQIGLAVRESQPGARTLGDALQRLAEALTSGLDGADSAAKIAHLRGDLVQAVTSLQFHDRMTQHLAHVRDYLVGSASQLDALEGVPEEPWASLHQQLSVKLLSDTQRTYLGKNFPAGYLAQAEGGPQSRAAPGDIDLF